MATNKDASQPFSTNAYPAHGVFPLTGRFETFIDIANLIGNNGLGPELDLSLFYAPENNQSLFYNWNYNFSYATSSTIGFLLEDNTLYYGRGQVWKWKKLADLSIPDVLVTMAGNGTLTFTHKDGKKEILTKFTTLYGSDILDYYLPTKIISPTGRTLNLDWKFHQRSVLGGLFIITEPRLTSATDDLTKLLEVSYATNGDRNTVVFSIWPGTARNYTYTLDIDYGSSSNYGLIKATPSNSVNSLQFEYTNLKSISALSKIIHASGLQETITYNQEGKVANHTSTLSNGTLVEDNNYTYTASNGRRRTTLTDIANRITNFYYDQDQFPVKETTWLNGYLQKTIETSRVSKNGNIVLTGAANEPLPDRVEITTTTTYFSSFLSQRSEEVIVTLDVLGNIIAKTENGVTTEWTYYRGMPKEEILVKTQTYQADLNALTFVARVVDNLNPVTWLLQIFGKAGLSWGTREIRTTVQSPFPTNTGKQTFNLPVAISCPGDPNYFKVYIESEKIYTISNGQRTDLQCTYYGYSALPVKGSLVKGPAVKPSIKLTVYDPIVDANGRLVSWQDGKMTVEETQYVTDVNSPHHGRVQSNSQRILDSVGNTVPKSAVTTTFNYSVANDQLTTATTITSGDAPPITFQETHQTFTGQLLSSTDSFGNSKTYQYDGWGRLVLQTDAAPGLTPINVAQISYSDSPQGSSVTRTSSVGEQTREVFDSLNRHIRTERLHTDAITWLIQTNKSYDNLGRVNSISDNDYRPDGSLFLARTRTISYDSDGAGSVVQWAGGATQGLRYDPVSRQQTQWIAYGSHNRVTETVITDRPGGGSVHEIYESANGHRLSSRSAAYNAQGRLIEDFSSTSPDRTYAYDSFGRPTHIRSAGETLINDYPVHTLASTATAARLESNGSVSHLGSRIVDSLGRVTQATVGGRTTAFTYTGNSHWGKANTARNTFQQGSPVTVTAAYDPVLNHASESTTGAVSRNSQNTVSTVSYTRSLRGVLLTETDAFGNTTTFSYDAEGRLSSSSNATAKVEFSFDTDGRLITETLTNQVDQKVMVTRYVYDDKNREIQRTFQSAGFKSLTMTQEYDSANRISGMTLYEDTMLLRKETFTYTPQGRLDTYTCVGSHKPVTPEGIILEEQKLNYDLNGNLIQCKNTSNGQLFTNTYQYDNTDPTRLLNSYRAKPDNTTRQCSFGYDSQGSLTNNNGITLTYNTAGKLGRIVSPKGTYIYYYNNAGQIVGCEGTNYYDDYFYKGDIQYARKGVLQVNGINQNRTSILLNQSSACVLQQNILSIGNTAPTISHSFEIKDIKGTVIASFNLLDNSSNLFAYTPFGYRAHDWEHHSWIGFNGQPIDRVSGGYHLGNGVRVYDPEHELFQSPDDKFSPFGAGGANNRSYCHNDPINYTDPSGHAEVVNQYTVITHGAAIESPVFQAVLFGAVGIALAPFTGGASVGWTVAATGLAVISAGFGIASAALQKSDPNLAGTFGWVSLGTGLASAGVATLGVKVAAKAALTSSARFAENSMPLSQRIVRETVSRRGNLPAGTRLPGTVNANVNGTSLSSTFELYSGGTNSRILYIDAHGTAMTSEHVLPPLTAEFQFRSALGVKAADVGTSWQTRVLGRTEFRHPPGATNIPNYILDEFTIAEHLKIGSIPAGTTQTPQAILASLAQQLNADILRPTSTVILSDLINELTLQGFSYDRIVGNFCRGSMPYDTPPLVQSIRRAFGMY